MPLTTSPATGLNVGVAHVGVPLEAFPSLITSWLRRIFLLFALGRKTKTKELKSTPPASLLEYAIFPLVEVPLETALETNISHPDPKSAKI